MTNTFRKGDKIKIAGRIGIFTVSHNNGPFVYLDDGWNSSHNEKCTLVDPTPKFKPGDRVSNGGHRRYTIKCVKTTYSRDGSTYSGPVAYDYTDGGWDREDSLTLVESIDTVIENLVKVGKKIEAMKQYRIAYGVGLLEDKNAVETIAAKTTATLGDILGKATGGFFKSGDVVTCPPKTQEYTVSFVDGIWTYFMGGGFAKSATLSIVSPAEPVSIVALIKNGQPRSNERPHVHKTNASATAEARRLADANPGVDFGVFTLTSVSTAPPPVVTPAATRVV